MALVRVAAGLAALLLAATAAACSAEPDQPGTDSAADPHASHRTYSPPPPAALREGERFLELSMPRPYTPKPPNGGTDDYRCFLIDPKLTDSAFLTGSQFLPENADVVHHAIFFRVRPGDVAQAQQLDANTPEDGWTCFGGTGISSGSGLRALDAGAAWVAAWAPGVGENLLGNKTGFALEPGSRLVMQVHYSTLAFKGKPATSDRSGIRLRLAPGTAGLIALQTMLLPAPVELPCAPNESGRLCDRQTATFDVIARFGQRAGQTIAGLTLLCGNGQQIQPGPTQSCTHKVREAGTLFAAAGHMHLLGRSIKVELNPGTPQAKILLNVDPYDFDDQGARALPAPVKVTVGDSLKVTCTHDATLRQQLPAMRTSEPRYVVWGDGTSDEMCLGIVTYTRA
jgi:Copper type II ascorbate-dependent monooxygenase, C-terminal domain